MEKKMVLKLELYDDKAKQKALRAVSSLSGIDSISMDMVSKKLTVIGDVDPINVVTKLRKMKLCHTEILTVGPAKEPEKKKEEPKKEEEKKKGPNEEIAVYPTYYPRMLSIDENPNACVIC